MVRPLGEHELKGFAGKFAFFGGELTLFLPALNRCFLAYFRVFRGLFFHLRYPRNTRFS